MEYLTKNIADNLTRHASKSYPQRKAYQIERILVHHSLTTTGSAAAYARYHVRNNGWPGIAYYMVIDPDGTRNICLNLTDIGYHCRGQNTKGIGICLTGNFDETDPTPQQIESLAGAIVDLREQLGRNLPVSGHNEFSAKTCPGTRFPWLDLFAAIEELETPPPPPAPEPEPDVEAEEPNPPPPAPEPPRSPGPAPRRPPAANPGCLAFFLPILKP